MGSVAHDATEQVDAGRAVHRLVRTGRLGHRQIQGEPVPVALVMLALHRVLAARGVIVVVVAGQPRLHAHQVADRDRALVVIQVRRAVRPVETGTAPAFAARPSRHGRSPCPPATTQTTCLPSGCRAPLRASSHAGRFRTPACRASPPAHRAPSVRRGRASRWFRSAVAVRIIGAALHADVVERRGGPAIPGRDRHPVTLFRVRRGTARSSRSHCPDRAV